MYLWEVRYSQWSADGFCYKYFKYKKKADAFANQDYHDLPERVWVKKENLEWIDVDYSK